MKDAQAGNPYALKAIEKAPKIVGQLHLHWTAFNELGSERIGEGGRGQIPLSKIKEYAVDELDYDDREKEAFVNIIRRSDIHFQNIQIEKLNKRLSK